jgi:hypothetical protein
MGPGGTASGSELNGGVGHFQLLSGCEWVTGEGILRVLGRNGALAFNSEQRFARPGVSFRIPERRPATSLQSCIS